MATEGIQAPLPTDGQRVGHAFFLRPAFFPIVPEAGKSRKTFLQFCLLSPATDKEVESGLSPKIRSRLQLTGDHSEQLCPQENQPRIPSSAPAPFPPLPVLRDPYRPYGLTQRPISCRGLPAGLGCKVPGAAFPPHPLTQRLWGGSPAVWKD